MRKVPVDNPRYAHHIKIVRKIAGDRWSEEEYSETTVYEGEGRSYTDTTTTGDAKVDTNKRKASIPVRFDEWDGLVPMSGDVLYATKGVITEQWEVKDFEPDNNRSVIYGELNRNLNVSDGTEEK